MILSLLFSSFIFFFNDPSTTEFYTLSLHDALPISVRGDAAQAQFRSARGPGVKRAPSESHASSAGVLARSEEHTSELQSHSDLVCRLLLEKKKTDNYSIKGGHRRRALRDSR